MRRLTLLLVLILSIQGCTSARTPFPDGAERGQTIEIEVRNRNFDQATLYAVRLGERSRLGIVEGKQDRTFRLAWRTQAPLRIEVVLQGGDRCVTRAIPVDPGDSVVMDVASDLVSDPDCT
jgi:hypothetical protein